MKLLWRLGMLVNLFFIVAGITVVCIIYLKVYSVPVNGVDTAGEKKPLHEKVVKNVQKTTSKNATSKNATSLIHITKGDFMEFLPNNAEFTYRIDSSFTPSICPTSMQQKMMNHSWSASQFRPQVQKVMHRGVLSREEYARLMPYNMPFGYRYIKSNMSYEESGSKMGKNTPRKPSLSSVDFEMASKKGPKVVLGVISKATDFNVFVPCGKYSELLDVVQLFPEDNSLFNFSNKPRPKCISCAVVGNGGILNGSKQGKEIDSHDMVFRVNHCIRRGHEEDVGNRTTHYVFMDRSLSHTEKKDIPKDEGIMYVFIPCRKADYRYISAVAGKPNPKLKFQTSAENIRILHPDFVRYSHKVWEATKSFRPTTGGLMLFSALHICDSVSVYGMGFTKSYSEHYYDKNYLQYHNVRGSHDFRKEIQIMNKLDQDETIKWYKRDVKQWFQAV